MAPRSKSISRALEGDVSPAGDDEVQESPTASRDEVILVVEDNRDVAANSVDMLTELGYKVLEAGDAAAAMRILDRTDGWTCCSPMSCSRAKTVAFSPIAR